MHITPLALLTLASAALAAPRVETRQTTTPPPHQVTVSGITTSGSGCPQGSVGQFLSADRTVFTLIFDSYIAQIGPGIAAAESRKFCQINLNLHYPQGFQYSIMKTLYRGFANLDKGVTGSQEATYYFSGQPTQVSTKSTFTGPLLQDYKVEDDLTLTSTIWSPCGADLPINIKTSVNLVASVKGAQGVLTDDSVDGNVTMVTGVRWRSC
ncbi:hypothetical protein HYALB_00009131 [Hymenoscyphus albidus]|uniref:Secreted protein n=1 Tax=Hymenoscyphus albidus TaxID=595503 RepID=A0A9N9LIC0_9HELO|nr:hypothetical protein HYALB_00009131 [Hymenoscyphus albidus]